MPESLSLHRIASKRLQQAVALARCLRYTGGMMSSADSVNPPVVATGATLPALREAVRHALQRVEQGERDSLEGLKSALCAFVAGLRAEGVSKEDAAQTVASMIREPTGPHGSLLPDPARDALVELATHWCAGEFASD